MADHPEEDLQKTARDYRKTIDLQVSSITDFEPPDDDYKHALADQVAVLEELKEEVKADPSVASPTTPRKRPAEVDGEEAVSPATPSKRPRAVKLVECSTCFESHSRKDSLTLRCCKTVYRLPCLHQWFTTALSAKILPKCCDKEIEPRNHRPKFTTPLAAQYRAVADELGAERKLWCAHEACGAFIKVMITYFTRFTYRNDPCRLTCPDRPGSQ